MKKHFIVKTIVIIILMIGILLLKPFLFIMNRIESLINRELSEEFLIIDFHFKYSFYGAYPLYAKLKIDQDLFESIRIIEDNYFEEHIHKIIMYLECEFESFNLDSVENVRYNQTMGAKYILFISGTTRITDYILTEEVSGNYYLYVYSY